MTKNNTGLFSKNSQFIVFLLLFFAPILNCFSLTVAGNWIAEDEKTHEPTSIILIQKRGQFYNGKIIKIFEAKGVKEVGICQSCAGSRKNQSILGLTIIENMVCSDGQNCKDGMILDPRDGNVYHAKMELSKNGDFLNVRGYIFIPLLGKSVVWQRQERGD